MSTQPTDPTDAELLAQFMVELICDYREPVRLANEAQVLVREYRRALAELRQESEAPKPEAFSESTKRIKFVVEWESREAAEEQARHAAAWAYLRGYLLGPDSAGWFSLKQERVTRADAIATGAAPIPEVQP